MNLFSLLFCALFLFSARISAVFWTNEDPTTQENDDSIAEENNTPISLAEASEIETQSLLQTKESQEHFHLNTCLPSTSKKFKVSSKSSSDEERIKKKLIKQHEKLLKMVKKFIPPPKLEKKKYSFNFPRVIFKLKEMQSNLQSIIESTHGINLSSLLVQQLQQELEPILQLQKFIEQARLEHSLPIDFLKRIFFARKVIKNDESLERWIQLRDYEMKVFKLKILFFEAGIELDNC